MWKLTSKRGLQALRDKHVAGFCVLLLFGFGWWWVLFWILLNHKTWNCMQQTLLRFLGDMPHFTKDWENLQSCKEPSAKSLKPNNVCRKMNWGTFTVTKSWKTRADMTEQIRILTWIMQTHWSFPFRHFQDCLQLPTHSLYVTWVTPFKLLFRLHKWFLGDPMGCFLAELPLCKWKIFVSLFC